MPSYVLRSTTAIVDFQESQDFHLAHCIVTIIYDLKLWKYLKKMCFMGMRRSGEEELCGNISKYEDK